MSDFLERLNRRLKRKQTEEPIRGSDESEEAGASEPPSPPATIPSTTPAIEPAAAPSPAAIVPLPPSGGEKQDSDRSRLGKGGE